MASRYVPVTDYETALKYNRAGLLLWKVRRALEYISSENSRDYYDTCRDGRKRFANDIKGDICHAILVEDDSPTNEDDEE